MICTQVTRANIMQLKFSPKVVDVGFRLEDGVGVPKGVLNT